MANCLPHPFAHVAFLLLHVEFCLTRVPNRGDLVIGFSKLGLDLADHHFLGKVAIDVSGPFQLPYEIMYVE